MPIEGAPRKVSARSVAVLISPLAALPAPLPEERGNYRHRGVEWKLFELARAGFGAPSPWREGRGEGDRSMPTSRRFRWYPLGRFAELCLAPVVCGSVQGA